MNPITSNTVHCCSTTRGNKSYIVRGTTAVTVTNHLFDKHSRPPTTQPPPRARARRHHSRSIEILGGWCIIQIIMVSLQIIHAARSLPPSVTRSLSFLSIGNRLQVSRCNHHTFRSFISRSTAPKQVAFLSPIQMSSRKYQPQHQPSSQASNLVALSFASVAIAAIVYHDDSHPNFRTIYSRRNAMTLCSSSNSNAIDPIEHQDKQGVAETKPPFSKSSKNNGTGQPQMLQSSIPRHQLEKPVLFPPECFDYDHYSGVTIDLEHIHDELENNRHSYGSITFAERLQRQLQFWRTEGIIRGVWIHVPPRLAAYVSTCIEHGFDFHMVTPISTTTTTTTTTTITTTTFEAANDSDNSSSKKNVLILSQWLPESTSRLPVGPTHQVGVGCLIWHPDDAPTLGSQRRLLVVQEKSGPAAAFRLWKLPTGLADPNEDIHDAAIRELYEETGLVGHFDGLLLVRQAHPNVVPTSKASNVTTSDAGDANEPTTKVKDDDIEKRTPKRSSVQRKTSDLFFICQMTLEPPPQEVEVEAQPAQPQSPIWTACPNEIAAIQWMSVQDYCNQQRWQTSPLYMELNRVILDAASSTSNTLSTSNINHEDAHLALRQATRTSLWNDTTLPVWVDSNHTAVQKDHLSSSNTYTNTFYSVKYDCDRRQS